MRRLRLTAEPTRLPFFHGMSGLTLADRLARHAGSVPSIAPSAFIAPGAVLRGAVSVGEESSIWFQTVVRADLREISIGRRSNLQDGCIVHVADQYAVEVGDDVSCGHAAVLHACRVENRVLIGMGAIVLDGAVIGSDTIVGARALITKGVQVPPRSLILGSPARVVRALDQSEIDGIPALAAKYVEVARYYRENS